MIHRLLVAACLLLGATSHARAQELDLPPEYRQFMDAARNAEAINDPLQRCLAYPDLPGNTWTPGMARKACEFFDTPSPISLGAIDLMLQARGGAKQVDALYRKELDASFHGEHDRVFRAFSPFGSCCIDNAERTARAWLAASPDSPYARTALGLVLAERGWKARGTALARATPASNFVQMQAFFDGAIAQFDAALKAEPRMLPACSKMISIGAQTSGELQARGISRCLEADPASYYVVAQMASAAEPKWGGSPAQMRAVADYAQSQMRVNPMLALLSIAPQGEGMLVEDPAAIIASYEPVGLRVPNPAVLRLAANGFNLDERDRESLRKALLWLSETLRFHPGDAWALRQRAQLLKGFKDDQWATRDAERAVVLDPDNTFLRVFLGRLLQEQGRHADALPHLRLAMADPRYHDSAAVLHCRVMLALEQWEEARACTDAITRQTPRYGDYWDMRLKALQTFDAPGAEQAMRMFLSTHNPVMWPSHAETARKVRAWMAAHGMQE